MLSQLKIKHCIGLDTYFAFGEPEKSPHFTPFFVNLMNILVNHKFNVTKCKPKTSQIIKNVQFNVSCMYAFKRQTRTRSSSFNCVYLWERHFEFFCLFWINKTFARSRNAVQLIFRVFQRRFDVESTALPSSRLYFQMCSVITLSEWGNENGNETQRVICDVTCEKCCCYFEKWCSVEAMTSAISIY